MKGQYQCKTANINEVKLMLEWAGKEGWNPGLHDYLPFFVTDPAGFFVGELDNTPIATLSALRFGKHYGFMGLYIVSPENRGQGYGLPLWRHGMNYLTGCNIGLDSVIAHQAKYQKSGFKRAHENIRFSGVIPKQTIHSSSLLPIEKLPFDKLLTYDGFDALRKFCPAQRF